MEKSISNKFYFDYNATSPLAKNVQAYLESGDLLFGNPASLHQTGKRSRKFINETNEFLFSIFNLDSKKFNLIHNSGATEGINTYFKGIAFHWFKENKKVSFYFSKLDHACVIELADDLKAFGHDVYFFNVSSNGELLLDEAVKLISHDANELKYLNYTWVNNETGVIWPLADALELKKLSGVSIHVDAVQSVGKIKDWQNLNSSLDAYSFSAHKFGALKGVGLFFVKKDSLFEAFIKGGAQQEGLRSGTENALGIYSVKLALLEIKEIFNADNVGSAKSFIESELLSHFGDKIEVLCKNAKSRNLNTIFLIVKNMNAQSMSMKFDMNKVALSTGSACSSGIVKENRIALELGHSAQDARSTLRFSFGPDLTMTEAQVYVDKIKSILS